MLRLFNLLLQAGFRQLVLFLHEKPDHLHMKIRNISFDYSEYDDATSLPGEDGRLVAEARDAALRAYAPYSSFRVGSAVRLESGIIVTGSNVENAAFPSGSCAENTAISNAVSNYPGDRPVAIAIAAMNSRGITPQPVTPCGRCRQVISEEESRYGKPVRIILHGTSKTLVVEKCSDLLPLQFSKDDLRNDRQK